MGFLGFRRVVSSSLVDRGNLVRRGPGISATAVGFALMILLSGALTLCLRVSHTTTSLGALPQASDPSSQGGHEGSRQNRQLSHFGTETIRGGEKWLVPFLILLALVVLALFAVLIIHIANTRSLRKREAVAAKQAAPELFQGSDNDGPTPRDRRGIWESKANQQADDGDIRVPEGTY